MLCFFFFKTVFKLKIVENQKNYEVTVDEKCFSFKEIFAVFVYMYLVSESNHR